ncbi:hypothetical protein C8J57DRAFT_1227124 [Mycena rebaudengoi]|nr:hypothetical protein C8J57DRAFT_1227124 [Mycena rebaudengoi]
MKGTVLAVAHLCDHDSQMTLLHTEFDHFHIFVAYGLLKSVTLLANSVYPLLQKSPADIYQRMQWFTYVHCFILMRIGLTAGAQLTSVLEALDTGLLGAIVDAGAQKWPEENMHVMISSHALCQICYGAAHSSAGSSRTLDDFDQSGITLLECDPDLESCGPIFVDAPTGTPSSGPNSWTTMAPLDSVNTSQDLDVKGGGDLSTKDTAFLRYLLDRSYEELKFTVFSLRAAFMATSSWPFYTQYDYTAPYGTDMITVHPVRHLLGLLTSEADMLRWADEIYRLPQSAGRVQLDVVMLTYTLEAMSEFVPHLAHYFSESLIPDPQDTVK